MKIVSFWFIWSLFPMVQLTICQHLFKLNTGTSHLNLWFRYCNKSITKPSDWLVNWGLYASLGLNEWKNLRLNLILNTRMYYVSVENYQLQMFNVLFGCLINTTTCSFLFYFPFNLEVLMNQQFNPQCVETKLIWFNILDIMVADALVPCITRTSTPMILTM